MGIGGGLAGKKRHVRLLTGAQRGKLQHSHPVRGGKVEQPACTDVLSSGQTLEIAVEQASGVDQQIDFHRPGEAVRTLRQLLKVERQPAHSRQLRP